MYLKIQAVIAKSYARIHRQNLINAGIVPLVFEQPDDYERIAMLDTLALDCGKLAEGQPLTSRTRRASLSRSSVIVLRGSWKFCGPAVF